MCDVLQNGDESGAVFFWILMIQVVQSQLIARLFAIQAHFEKCDPQNWIEPMHNLKNCCKGSGRDVIAFQVR